MKKEVWRQNWLETINELSGYTLKNKSNSIRSQTVVHRSFNDIVNAYFEELLFGFDYDFYTNEMNWLTQAEFKIIEEWHNELENYIVSNNCKSLDTAGFNLNKCLSIINNGRLVKKKLQFIIPLSEKQYLK